MSSVLKCDESIRDGVQRLLARQLGKARDCLRVSRATESEAIHDARKSLKKARALMRLVRSELGEAKYARWNACARDIARVVSGARDAQVLVASLDGLLEAFNEQISSGAFRLPRAALLKIARESVHEVGENRGALREARTRLEKLCQGVNDLRLPHDGWRAIAPNLERVYRQGRRAFREAYAQPADIAFHEWRKSAKYLRHQIDTLRDTWTEPLKELSEQLHALSNLLGEDHDLVMLRERVQGDPDRFGSTETVRALYALIERRQEHLRQQARPLGERLYVEKPRAFTRRLHGYWQSWHRPKPAPQPLPSLLQFAGSAA